MTVLPKFPSCDDCVAYETADSCLFYRETIPSQCPKDLWANIKMVLTLTQQNIEDKEMVKKLHDTRVFGTMNFISGKIKARKEILEQCFQKGESE
jgi:hypothetical protein